VRTRIALVAAIAACIIFSAAAAGAVAIIGKPALAGVKHARHRRREHWANNHPARTRTRQTSLLSPELIRSIEWKQASQRVHSPALPTPAPPSRSTVATPAAPAPEPVVVSDATSDATSTTTPDWACIRDHESGDNYAEDTGNGYSGAYQFMPSTWDESVSGAGYPQYANGAAYQAPPVVQNAAALWLYDRDGWSPWSTRFVCGL
jgi:Transglycosylase-like domain